MLVGPLHFLVFKVKLSISYKRMEFSKMEFWGAKIVISKHFNVNYFGLNDKEIH